MRDLENGSITNGGLNERSQSGSVINEWLSTFIAVEEQPVLPMLAWIPNIMHACCVIFGKCTLTL